MVTINVSIKTKNRFNKEKIKYSASINKKINEDIFINILLNHLKLKKSKGGEKWKKITLKK